MKTVSYTACMAALIVAFGTGNLTAANSQQDPQQQQQQPQTQQQAQTQNTQPSSQPQATAVRLSQLEDNPQQYLGKHISIAGEVDEVLGPRVFKIDESNWADLDGEILVVMEAPLAALVSEEDPVTVTGTLRPFVDVQVEREWGWIGPQPELEADFRSRPVLVARSVVGADPSVGMVFAVTPATGQQGQTAQGAETGTTGTSGRTAPADSRPALTEVTELAKANDNQHVGRRVDLTSVRVDRTAKAGGFWITSGGEELYVLSTDQKVKVQPGQTVSIEGRVLRLPEQMEDRIEKSKKVGNEEIYIYATTVK